MTVRDAIQQSIPVFVAHSTRDIYALRSELQEAGIPSDLAAEIVEFLPLALARALMNGMGIQFTDHYIRQTSRGRIIGEKPLADEPVYREGLALADEIVRMGSDTFMAIAGWSSEYRAVNQALKSGATAANLSFRPPVVSAGNDDERDFDDTTGGRQPREKRWWQFWK